MKRLYYSLALLMSVPLIAGYKHDDRSFSRKGEYSKTIAQFINDVQGKEIQQPSWLIEKWFDVKGDKFKLASQEMAAMARDVKGPKEREAFMDIAKELADLGEKFKNAPIPHEDVKKKLTNVNKWIALQARIKHLQAKQYKVVGEQLDSRAAFKIAHRMKKVAESLKQALEYARDADQDDDFDIDRDED